LESFRIFKHDLHFYKKNVEDEDVHDIFAKHEIDVVINLAAQAGVRYSLVNPKAYVKSNIDGFLNILECCRIHPVKHLVFASSSSVYGLNHKTPYSEDDNVDHPVSLYAATKKSNELMAHVYSHLFKIPATGLRFFTVYGPWGRQDRAYYSFTQKKFFQTSLSRFQ
jgi:UDP-glucuronate 4-epimerase